MEKLVSCIFIKPGLLLEYFGISKAVIIRGKSNKKIVADWEIEIFEDMGKYRSLPSLNENRKPCIIGITIWISTVVLFMSECTNGVKSRKMRSLLNDW